MDPLAGLKDEQYALICLEAEDIFALKADQRCANIINMPNFWAWKLKYEYGVDPSTLHVDVRQMENIYRELKSTSIYVLIKKNPWWRKFILGAANHYLPQFKDAVAAGDSRKVENFIAKVYLTDQQKKDMVRSAIKIPNHEDSAEITKILLANYDIGESLSSMLVLAAGDGKFNVVRELLQKIGKPSQVVGEDALIAAAAAETGSYATVRLLVENGVDPSASDNAALSKAYFKGNKRAVGYLLQHPNVKNKFIKYPSDFNRLTSWARSNSQHLDWDEYFTE